MSDSAAWRVAIDTGGTFTDAYFFNEKTGKSHVAKVSSTPASPELAVLESIRAGGITPADIRLLTHGRNKCPDHQTAVQGSLGHDHGV